MSFGSNDFVKLADDFGTDTGAIPTVFDIIPAVRNPTGSCIDESGCDYEKITLCAFQGVDQMTQVYFLVRHCPLFVPVCSPPFHLHT